MSRRGYWSGVAAWMVVLIALALWAGLYVVDEPEGGAAGPTIENVDPLMQLMYNPVGVVVITLVLQFLAANVLFWVCAWVWYRLRRRGRAATG